MKFAALVAIFLSQIVAKGCTFHADCREPKPFCLDGACTECILHDHCKNKGAHSSCVKKGAELVCTYPTCMSKRHRCGPGKQINLDALHRSCVMGECTDDICCEATPCKVVAPVHGNLGGCNENLASGSVCQPACEPGYKVSGLTTCSLGKLTAATCDANTCVCEHGTADAGKDCSTDGATECKACNKNYHLEGNDGTKSCEANTCVCEHGTADAGKDCSADGATECKACNKNYHLEGNDGTKSCEVDSCKTPSTLAEKHIQEVSQSKILTKTGFNVVLKCMNGFTSSSETEVKAVECAAHEQAYKFPAKFKCDIVPASPRVENSAGSSQQNAGLKVATTTKSHDPRSVAARSSAQSDGTSWLISVIMAASLVALCLFLWWRFWHMRGDSSRRSSSAAEDLESPSDYSARHGSSRRPSRRRASQRNESEEVCGTQMPDRPRLASRDGARARSRTASMMSSIPQRRSVTCSERALVGEALGGTTRKNTNEMYGASDGARGAEELTESAQKSARKAGGARTPWPREADPEATSRRIDRLDSNGRDVRFDSNPYKFKRQAIVKRDDSMFGERSCYLCENKEHAHRSKNSHHKPQKKADHIGAKCTTRQDVAI